MTLFLIHCGYYDEEIYDGIYEFHINIPVLAQDSEMAKKKVRAIPLFIAKKMHIDGIQKIECIDGYTLEWVKTKDMDTSSVLNIRHRDL